MGDETRVTRMTERGPRGAADGEACLVQIHGPRLGKRYVLPEGEVTLGRDEGCDIVVELDNVSRRHARIVQRAGRVSLEDLHSTNGTFLNEAEVTLAAPLRSGDLVRVGGAIFKFLTGDNVESLYHETIYTLTIVDGLTGVHNKRYFLEYLEREMGRAHRYGRPLSLLLFDIDHFKRVNDVHGHLAGDFVLRELAQTLRPLVRKEQCLARYGGEEFVLVIPEDGPDKARHLAEKLRRRVAERPFCFDAKDIPVTVSVGVADMASGMSDPLQFLRVADANLYRAKSEGRDRVVG